MSPIAEGLEAEPSPAWRLIDLIYETGQHPEEWPSLLEAMVGAFASQHTLRRWKNLHNEEAALSNRLAEHLTQALVLNQHIGEQFNALHTVEPVLATLTFPLLVIDENYRLVYVSDRYSTIMHRNAHVTFKDGQALFDEAAKASVERVLNGVSSGEPLPIEARSTDHQSSLEAFVLPLSRTASPKLCMLAWFDADTRIVHCSNALAETYGLTDAEAQLIDGLLADNSYAELAEQRGVTEHTVRSQVKQIFAKTDVHSRAELVQKAYCGPELLNRLVQSRAARFFHRDLDTPRCNQTLTLACGNRLGFAEYGPQDGRPLLFIHNVTGSRLQLPVPEDRCYEQGIRLIMPDRPGIGLSDWCDDFSMRYWGDAVAALLDELALKRVLLMGNSMGGIYALAAAALHPERFERMALVSTMAELDADEDLSALEEDMRRVVTIARRAPQRVARKLLQLVIRDVPNHYLDRRIGKLPSVDQKMYQDPAFYEMAVTALQENLQRGGAPMVRDLMLLAAPWEFRVEDVTVPVQCWHGTLDITSPIGSVQRLARRLPECREILVPGETHMLIYRHWNTILASLMDPQLLDDERPLAGLEERDRVAAVE